MFYTSCGHETAPSSIFCNTCGARLDVLGTETETSSENAEFHPVVTSIDFVGRQREMGDMVAALGNALSGHGQVVMLSGDPGIGKTRIAQELSAIADAQNAEVHWGHCYEGEGAPPYWPWIQIIRSYIDQSDAESLKESMGSGAEAIAEFVPEMHSKLPNLEPPPTFDPDSARFRLFDSITTYLKNTSATRPLVLILEDLHWADASSLALLEYISGNIAASSLVIVGTYRDSEVSLDHPLSRTLGSLVRHGGFQSLQLGGLSLGEVGELVTLSIGSNAPQEVVEQVHRRTEGNALFVSELLKLLETNGLDEAQGWQFTIPQEIRGVISRRFDGLSDGCNHVLKMASVIGREFDFDLLGRITDSSDDDLLDVVDEAVSAHVIEDMPGARERYRFSHALIEQTLYERQTTSRRARLHARIGETLEDLYGEDVEAHASELVSHFSRSSRRQDSEKALRYGRAAAQHATSVYAYGEAVTYLEQCLDVQKSLNPHDDETRCDRLIALGEGLIIAGEPQRAFEDIAPEAFTMAEARDDSGQAFRSCHVAIQGLMAFGVFTGQSMPEFRQWAERADKHAEPETTDRIEADLAMASPKYVSHEYPEAWHMLHRALRLARQLGEPEYLVRCNLSFLGWGWPPQYQKEVWEIARESADSPVLDVSPRLWGEFLATIAKHLRLSGDWDRAGRVYDQFLVFVERTKIPFLRVFPLIWDIRFKTDRGELEDAVEVIDHLIVGSEKLGSAAFGLQFAATIGMRPLLYLGRVEEALSLLPQARRHVGLEADNPSSDSLPSNSSEYVLCLAHAGHLAQAREYFSLVMEGVDNRLARRQVGMTALIHLLETAVLLEDVDVSKAVANQLEEMADGPGIARQLGKAANLSGESERALEYFHKALEVSTDMGDRPEVALSRFDIAELLLGCYPDQRIEALEHLEFAIAEFRDMKMQPSVDRALALKEKAESQPSRRPTYPDGLTRREVEVLRLIVTGMTNRQIAEELVVSQKTVAYHVTNILNKTTSSNRAEATAYAVRQNLTS